MASCFSGFLRYLFFLILSTCLMLIISLFFSLFSSCILADRFSFTKFCRAFRSTFSIRRSSAVYHVMTAYRRSNYYRDWLYRRSYRTGSTCRFVCLIIVKNRTQRLLLPVFICHAGKNTLRRIRDLSPLATLSRLAN